jgi:hypothetical protein
MTFTGRLPDPSRSWVKYESDLDLSNLEVFEFVRIPITQTCERIEAIEEETNDSWGRRKRVMIPYCQINAVKVTLDGLSLTINAIGSQVGHGPNAGKEKTAVWVGWFCYHCKAIWTGANIHQKSDCPVFDAQYVMES